MGAAGRLLGFLVGLFAICAWAQAQAQETQPLRKCLPKGPSVPQPFKLPALKIHWATWDTSEITTSVAAILLSEKLGFPVELVPNYVGRELYEGLSKGEVHLSFEAWPKSNVNSYSQFVGTDFESGQLQDTGDVWSYPYTTLFGRSGLFETCSRLPGDAGTPLCIDQAMLNSPPLLSEVLKTEKGQNHFKLESVTSPVSEWLPPQCYNKTCDVQIMHIAPKGYDEGMVEKLVQTLGLQAKVVYLGEDAHTNKIWQSYKKRAGTIVYSYFPNINQHGIPILSLHRAEIPPEEDFKPQQLRKLAWPGLQKHRGGDALEFVQNFDLTQKDYTELSRLFDLFGEPQVRTCTTV